METKVGRTQPLAVFMAFGTKGDVYPIAAIAAAFAREQKQYKVVLISHLEHENLSCHLDGAHVTFLPIRAPPVLMANEILDFAGPKELSFSLKKGILMREHRHNCYVVVEGILGDGPVLKGDFILINFFALEGWSLAEHFHVRCVVAAPYVVPYSEPSSFERHFKETYPSLFTCLQQAPIGKVCWRDISHWMWPIFMENWGSWRTSELNLSLCPFTDPITGLPVLHDWPSSPLLLYGFSKQVVECPDYWPSNVRVCGFWFLPIEWQFSCEMCGKVSAWFSYHGEGDELCPSHMKLHCFSKTPACIPLVFIGINSIGSMGFLTNPEAFLRIIRTVVEAMDCRVILFTAGYEKLDEAAQVIADNDNTCCSNGRNDIAEGIYLFADRVLCFSGMVPYRWLFPKCVVAVHHGGSGSTAAALHAGIPQVICPFVLDQFYWAEKMFWLGVAPEPLKRDELVPDSMDEVAISAAARALARAINFALSPPVKARAVEIAGTLSAEADGVLEAVKILKQEVVWDN